MENIQTKKKLYLLCGVPASGKSTFIQGVHAENPDAVWCSRDNVRFSILKDGEDYFSHEDEVYDMWIHSINHSLMASHSATDIYVDATHLNKRSRLKTLNRLNLVNAEVIPVYFNVPLDICLERNAKREGRARVPSNVIRQMFNIYSVPNANEYPYSQIIEINENGEQKVIYNKE